MLLSTSVAEPETELVNVPSSFTEGVELVAIGASLTVLTVIIIVAVEQ